LHPVAVTLARVSYLLALTPERLADRDELTVPVFLGDSVRWEHDDIRLSDGGITVRTSDELELVEDELHFPEAVVEEPARFDRLVADLAARAAKRKRGTKPPSVEGILNRHRVVGEADRDAVTTVFHKLCRLHDGRRDHLWSYYIRNRARPLVFTRPERRADVLVGNPPWLAFRSMSEQLQERYRSLAEQRGLWAGGKVATHQDLSDLFVVRAVELYLRRGGRFAFVMPFAVLSRRQFTGFRTGEWMADGHGALAQLRQPEEFARVKPPPFQVPACVISGVKAQSASPLPAQTTSWQGRVPSRQLDWLSASEHLHAAIEDVAAAADVEDSLYRSRFRQGASLVPRVLVCVEPSPASSLGVVAGRVPVRSARSVHEKTPWKRLPSLEGVVEARFVRPMHAGATIVAFRAREPQMAIVPWAHGRLLDSDDDRLDEFPGLAHWWREAELQWLVNRAKANRLTLSQQVDFQSKLTKQFPIAAHRIVYTKSGQHLAACRIDDPNAIIDHKLYWAGIDTVDEARYLCAVLNSQVLADVVVGLQARGQHNPRDFDMHVFALPFPTFDPADHLHIRLAQLARRAEAVTQTLDFGQRRFQDARRMTREALREDGVAHEIDVAVSELVGDAVGVPDLMAIIAGATKRVGVRSRRDLRADRTASPGLDGLHQPPAPL
jgi:hypothetical protein